MLTPHGHTDAHLDALGLRGLQDLVRELRDHDLGLHVLVQLDRLPRHVDLARVHPQPPHQALAPASSPAASAGFGVARRSSAVFAAAAEAVLVVADEHGVGKGELHHRPLVVVGGEAHAAGELKVQREGLARVAAGHVVQVLVVAVRNEVPVHRRHLELGRRAQTQQAAECLCEQARR